MVIVDLHEALGTCDLCLPLKMILLWFSLMRGFGSSMAVVVHAPELMYNKSNHKARLDGAVLDHGRV